MRHENRQGLKVLLLGAVLQLFLGIIYVWSVFVTPVSEYFNWNINDVKLTFSFMLSLFVIGMLIGGKLESRFGTVKLTLAGGVLMSLGMLITSFIPISAPWIIYISYGITGGFGVGMAYNSIISCAQKWFPHKRGLATGISVFAFGFSTVLFAPLVELFIGTFGLVGTFRVLSAVFFGVVVLMFRFIKLPPDLPQVSGGTVAHITEQRLYSASEMLRTKEFYFMTLALMLGTVAYFVLNPSFKTLSLSRGLSAETSTAIVMMTGIANAIGRLSVPTVSDKVGRENTGFLIFILTIVSSVLLAFAQGFIFMASVAVIAFAYGGFSGIFPLFTSDYFGVKNVGANYALVMCGFAISSLSFPTVLNLISDDYLRFIVIASMVALGSLMVILLKISKKKFLLKK